MRLKFKVIGSALKGLEWETDGEVVNVGRSSDNELVLKERSVSRLHARIVAREGTITVEDFGSSNQTKVDGEPVGESALLSDGSIVEFGDVVVEVRCPDLEPTLGTPEGSASEARTPAVPGSWLAPAQSRWRAEAALWRPAKAGAPLPVAVERGVQLERRVWPVLTLVVGVLAALVLVMFFLNRSGGMGGAKWEFGVPLRANEQKVVEVPKGFVYDPVVEFPGTVEVKRPLNLDVAVQINGLKQGLTTVTLYDTAGEYIRIYVNVLPLERKEAERALDDQVRTDKERIDLAIEGMKRGEVLEEQRALYEAMEEYGRALALLAPFERNPNRWYTEALDRYDRISYEIQDQYDRLTNDMGDYVRVGDKRMALERLAEIKDLIPEERDVRRQNADLLFRLLEKAIETENRGAGRRP
jgi:tetratricopeptide (TPR) repeat protein